MFYIMSLYNNFFYANKTCLYVYLWVYLLRFPSVLYTILSYNNTSRYDIYTYMNIIYI